MDHSPTKSPAFQFYAAEYLADEHVQLMSLEEEGAYIRAIAYCWREGSIPKDSSALSRLLKGGSTTVIRVVQARFNQDPTNAERMVHPRLERERQKQEDWRKKSAKGGEASAHKRKTLKAATEEQGGSDLVQPNFNRTVQPNGNSSSSSSSLSLNTIQQRRGARLPTNFPVSDKIREFARRDLPGLDVDRAFAGFKDHFTAQPGSRGCKLDWDATLRNWLREAHRRNGRLFGGDHPNSAGKGRLIV